MFVTMVGGVYDPETGIVRLANAGHEPPLFHDRQGDFTPLPAQAPPLGILSLPAADGDFPETELRLDGGTLYVFTDGVTEGYADDGAPLEVEGLKALIRKNDSLTLAGRVDAVISCLKQGAEALRDDVTVLAIEDRRKGGNG